MEEFRKIDPTRRFEIKDPVKEMPFSFTFYKREEHCMIEDYEHLVVQHVCRNHYGIEKVRILDCKRIIEDEGSFFWQSDWFLPDDRFIVRLRGNDPTHLNPSISLNIFINAPIEVPTFQEAFSLNKSC